MNVPRWIVARVRRLWRRNGVAAEISEELSFHLAARIDEYERAGLSRHDARRKAQARVGNVAIHLDRGYDVRGGNVMDSVAQDLRHSARLFGRQPVFAAIAIVTLALGIGAATAIFSVIDAAILHPLPYPAPEQIVDVAVEVPQPNGRSIQLGPSLTDADVWRQSTPVFSQLAASRSVFPERILDGPEPMRVDSLIVSSEYLPLYGVVPVLGRAFTEGDEQPGAPAVAMLGYSIWQSRFGGSRDVVGTTIRYDSEPMTIVGVLPASFQRDMPIWRPLVPAAHEMFKTRRGTGGSITGRLRDGVTLDDAQRVLTAALPIAAGQSPEGTRVSLRQALASTTRRYWPTVTTLAGSVGLILLIACVNVAGLLLARGATRHGEVAVRASLGASRRRLIRQLLTESLLLSTIGGALGIALAWLTLRTLVANIPISLSIDAPAQINGAVLAASVAVTLLTGVVFGLIPALRLSRVSLGATMARAGRQHGVALTKRGGQSLIAIEVALAVVMLAGAGLMIRSFSRLVSTDIGFDPSRFVALEALPVDPAPAVHGAYYPALLQQLRALPSIVSAGAIDYVPLGGGGSYTSAKAGDKSASVSIRQVLPGYFETIGLAPVAGRVPADADLASAEKSIVLAAGTARELFHDQPAIGRQVVVGKITRTVIGVVPDVRHDGPGNAGSRSSKLDIYVPFEPTTDRMGRARGLTVLVATRGATPNLAADLRRAATAIGTPVIVERVRSGADLFSDGVALPRRRTVMLSILGGFGLLLSIVGVVGMTSYAVARRTREIGVRMAFGARTDQVVRSMLVDAMWPIAIGVAAGIGGAWLSTGVIKSFLFETTPTDPATLAVVAVTLAAAASMAAWIPARRAARVDPVSALRSE